VLVTASPLVLDRVDHVVLLGGGRVLAEGSHHELLAADHDGGRHYRDVVSRAAAAPPHRTELDPRKDDRAPAGC
jgi:ABC-type multidrug transport system fused ATPase/permease subunit